MLKRYVGKDGAQVHFRELASQTPSDERPLLCLPPSPHTGLYFTRVMPMLNSQRNVIALDYPGFGGSDPLAGDVSIAAYTERVIALLEDIGPADLLGFHSGNLIAAELAITRPDLTERIVMVDVPYFNAETRAKYHAMMAADIPLPNSVSDLESEFEKQITKRLADLGPARAYELWVETLRSGRGLNSAFRAAFSYDCEAVFAKLAMPITVIATQSSLLEHSRKAAQALENASLIENLDVDRAVFEVGAESISKTILQALNG